MKRKKNKRLKNLILEALIQDQDQDLTPDLVHEVDLQIAEDVIEKRENEKGKTGMKGGRKEEETGINEVKMIFAICICKESVRNLPRTASSPTMQNPHKFGNFVSSISVTDAPRGISVSISIKVFPASSSTRVDNVEKRRSLASSAMNLLMI